MIDQWGTEIAIVIALITGSFVLWVGKDEFKKTKMGRTLVYTLVMLLTLTVLLYLGLRFSGVNL
jgi:hypothetical protein